MDEIDRNILVALQEDGAAGLAELAKVAGLSVSATAERVKRLEERGTIRGWRADLDPAAIGCPMLAFVFVELRAGKDETAFRTAMRGAEPVLECHRVTGGWTYLLKLRLPDLAAVERFVAEAVRGHAGVARTETLLAIGSAKETSILPVAEATEE
ncbi:Lrp/AsnC family transcriptional regulator [Roseomonas haemaphysalidis]|jgi:Lrp/AsnC family leucine-responsive transcriptional regulator|uniref:Lrp/AsnC family transcriptional regulator n=1 Tax=Roseomonas haemaphysalidis TaxID=2768162 RepID=A0ABS3KR54_9PROT|nr:Lrp/AsnC family transcriptional regulator [Roseomonas haemaphysalidis]MBO1079942.1 Lrp/AsnC family transcriptional regulator [Roseomonas haemaphysalidis]